MNDFDLYNKLKGVDLGTQSDDYFKSLNPAFSRGRQDAIDFVHRMKQSDPAYIAQQQEEKMQKRFAADREELAGFNTRFSEAVPKALNDASTKYDVAGKLDLTTGLRSRIDDLKNNISGYGAGGYASGQQVDRAIGLKYVPQYNTAAQNLQDASSLALDEANFAIKPLEIEGEILTDRMAREATGYGESAQRELDALLTIYETNASMSEAQKDRLHELAVKEQEYEYKRQNPDTEVITVGGRKKLINKQTGAVISDLGSSSESSGSGTGFTNYLSGTNATPTPTPSGGNAALEALWQGTIYEDKTPEKVKQQIISGNLKGINLNGLNLGKPVGY